MVLYTISNNSISQEADLVMDETTTITKTCPYCAETINVSAIRCKHCQADLVNPSFQSAQSDNKNAKAKDHPSYWTFTILAILMPGIGTIIGIVYLCKSLTVDKRVGEHTLVVSILFWIIWTVVYLSFIGGSVGHQPIPTQ
jgi:hypothetical protein